MSEIQQIMMKHKREEEEEEEEGIMKETRSKNTQNTNQLFVWRKQSAEATKKLLNHLSAEERLFFWFYFLFKRNSTEQQLSFSVSYKSKHTYIKCILMIARNALSDPPDRTRTKSQPQSGVTGLYQHNFKMTDSLLVKDRLKKTE